MDKEVVVLFGAGSIGTAIARRIGVGKHILVADRNEENINITRKILSEAGYNNSGISVDISKKEEILKVAEKAKSLGKVQHLIQAAGVSPSQASVETILKVDLYGTAVILEEFGKIIEPKGTGIVISSQSGYRLPALTIEENKFLATAPADELLDLPFVKEINDTLKAYQISKRGNVLRVAAESVKWGRKGARINSLSPGIIMTPLALDELNGPRSEFYRNMLDKTAEKRAGVSDEVAGLAELIMKETGGFINGSDFLIDGGVTAHYWFGDLKPDNLNLDEERILDAAKKVETEPVHDYTDCNEKA